MRAGAGQYVFKPEPYSSHSLLLADLPERGGGRRVLDVGCAAGYLSAALHARGYEVTAIERPGFATGLPAGVELIEADLEDGVPVLEGTFDYILCADVLEHLRDPAGALKALGQYLAPEGRLLASLPNGANLYVRLHVLLGRFPEHDRGLFDRTHLHFCELAKWRRIFARAGFRFERVRPTALPFSLALPRLGPLARAMESAWHKLALVRKQLFAYQFVVTAVRER